MAHVILLAIVCVLVVGCGQQDTVVAPPIAPESVVVAAVDDVVLPAPLDAFTERDHVRGDHNAPVKIVVYSDFECPFCAELVSEEGSIAQAEVVFGSELAIAFRHYPLSFHQQGWRGAEASECAAAQGEFWEMHDLLFADTRAGQLHRQRMYEHADSLGLDTIRFNECFDNSEFSAMVEQAVRDAHDAGVRGTPTLFVNGRQLVGAVPFEDYDTAYGVEQGLQSVVAEELAKVVSEE